MINNVHLRKRTLIYDVVVDGRMCGIHLVKWLCL
jgi:hypothetical protein